MAKQQEPAENTRNQKNSKTSKKIVKSNTSNTKSKRTINSSKAINDDSSGEEEPRVLSVPSSSTESQNDDVSEEEDDGADEVEASDGDEKEEKEKPGSSSKKKGKKEDVKNKGKKRNKIEEDEEEEKSESALYRIPMNRVSRIIRSEISDVKISQEAVFVINRASEKFLELFSKEAYACAFIDRKNHIAYNHMSSVVSKRSRFSFLSDFVPEKVKAEDALAQIPEAKN